jgi:multimeric flavodoxin WrbA
LDDFLNIDAIAWGTPDDYSYPAGTLKTFFNDLYPWDKAGIPVKGKPMILFMSHGGGGRAKQLFEGLQSASFSV